MDYSTHDVKRTGISNTDDTPQKGDPTDPDSAPLPLDDLLHLLQNERRRIAVRTVAERGACSLRQLSESVAKQTTPHGDGDTHCEHRTRMRIALMQSHVPKLEKHGVLVEAENDRYELGPAGEQFLASLDAVETLMEVRGGQDVATDGGSADECRRCERETATRKSDGLCIVCRDAVERETPQEDRSDGGGASDV